MAKCPACGRKLHFINWKPNCPSCGVNLNYYKSNEMLLDESEAAEIEHSKFQPKVDRAKAATIGTNVGRIRLALFIIPIAAFFLPLFTITVSGNKTNYNAISIYNFFSAVDAGKVLGNISPIVLAVLFLIIPAVGFLVFSLMQIAAGTKKGLKKNIVLSSIAICLVTASLVSVLVFAKSPTGDYASLVLSEAEYAVSNGGQSQVDSAVEKLKNIINDETADYGILERAIKNGEKSLKNVKTSGYTKEDVSLITESLENGKKVLEDKDASIGEIRDAASAINTAAFCYKDLETALYYAGEIKNDGIYSEKSFGSLMSAIEEGKAITDSLKKGEAIVELEDDDGTGAKTDEEIAEDTAKKVEEATQRINNAAASLTDVSVITPLCEKVKSSVEDKTADGNVKASVGIGLFVLLLLYAVQLGFNIVINKKGFEVKYTPCLIGGLPSEEYYEYVEQGMSKEEIRRKMLVRLAKMQDEYRLKQEEAENKEVEEKLKEIEERMASKGSGVEK